jgi:hypothetical protein
VPVLAANDVGPIEAIKESAGCSRAPGANAIGRTGMGVAFAMLFLLVLGCGTGSPLALKRIAQRIDACRG